MVARVVLVAIPESRNLVVSAVLRVRVAPAVRRVPAVLMVLP
jgi:hypothetical protein